MAMTFDLIEGKRWRLTSGFRVGLHNAITIAHDELDALSQLGRSTIDTILYARAVHLLLDGRRRVRDSLECAGLAQLATGVGDRVADPPSLLRELLGNLLGQVGFAGVLQNITYALLDGAQLLLQHARRLLRLRFDNVKLLPRRFQGIRFFQLLGLFTELSDIVLDLLVLIHFRLHVVEELREEAGPATWRTIKAGLRSKVMT